MRTSIHRYHPVRLNPRWVGLSSLILLTILFLCSTLPLMATGPTVTVWADTNANCSAHAPKSQRSTIFLGSSPCGIDGSSHSLVFGPGFQNLFLVQNGVAYSTTGPSGSTPGVFTSVGVFGDRSNEGSVVLTAGGTPYLFVMSEWGDINTLPISGSGGSVALGSYDGYGTGYHSPSAEVGQLSAVGDPEGAALMNGSPRFSNGIPVFATAGVGSTLTVNGNTLPVIDPHWSGQTLLVASEYYPGNLVAVAIDNDGTPNVQYAVALGTNDGSNNSFSGDMDQVAISQDNRFAYVHEEGDDEFFRVDLNHLDVTGGNAHIQEFLFPHQTWIHDPMTVLGSFVYAVANPLGYDRTAPGSLSGYGNQVYRMAIDPATGNLGDPQFVVTINDGRGNYADGYSGRLTTDGKALYASDDDTGLIFQIAVYTGCTQDVQKAGSFEVNPITGDYSFTVASTGQPFSGQGTVLYSSGCTLILVDLATPGKLVKVFYNVCTNTGVAYVQNTNPFAILLVSSQTAPSTCPF